MCASVWAGHADTHQSDHQRPPGTRSLHHWGEGQDLCKGEVCDLLKILNVLSQFLRYLGPDSQIVLILMKESLMKMLFPTFILLTSPRVKATWRPTGWKERRTCRLRPRQSCATAASRKTQRTRVLMGEDQRVTFLLCAGVDPVGWAKPCSNGQQAKLERLFSMLLCVWRRHPDH